MSIKEFDLLDDDAVVLEFRDEIEALVTKFHNSGQSGGSAPYVAAIITSVVEKLCMSQPINGLTYKDHEWNDVSEISCEPVNTSFQNNRDSRVFKDNDGVYFIPAIIWKEPYLDSYSTFTGRVGENNEYNSHQYLPLNTSPDKQPKTFYVSVLENEDGAYIPNKDELTKALSYYEK